MEYILPSKVVPVGVRTGTCSIKQKYVPVRYRTKDQECTVFAVFAKIPGTGTYTMNKQRKMLQAL